MNTPQEEFTLGDENDYQCFIGVGIGIGIGVEKVPGSSFDTDPDSDPDPDPDGKLSGRIIGCIFTLKKRPDPADSKVRTHI